jgi:DNA-binding NtrC family response regulator
MQAALLRFLENGEIQTIGDRAQHVDVRLIAATNRDLGQRVASGDFREDLLYRLRVIEIKVPALRDRRDDIPALTEYFLRRAPRPLSILPEARQALERYRWPGNVRELQNIIEQATWLARGSAIALEDLPESVRNPTSQASPVHERRRQLADQLFEALVAGQYSFWDHVHPLFLDRDLTRHDIREMVKRALRETKGNYRAVLRLFGMPESDYHRFHNFLTAHACKVDFRNFRTGVDLPCDRPPSIFKVS